MDDLLYLYLMPMLLLFPDTLEFLSSVGRSTNSSYVSAGLLSTVAQSFPIIEILDFFVIHSAIWPAVRMSQLLHCNRS